MEKTVTFQGYNQDLNIQRWKVSKITRTTSLTLTSSCPGIHPKEKQGTNNLTQYENSGIDSLYIHNNGFTIIKRHTKYIFQTT